MCGRGTFEILVSSSSMNVAIVTVSAIAHGLYPCVAKGSWAGNDSRLDALCLAVSAAIPLARLTFRDATDGPGLPLAQRGFSQAAAAQPLRNCLSHSLEAEG